jgi:hypothetical protein
MTCNNCGNCKCEPQPTQYELAMNKAGDVLEYALDHVDHPQFDRIKYPNRVSVGGYFAGIHEDEFFGPRIYLWESDKPDEDPIVYINRTAMGLHNVDATPPMITSKEMNDLMAQFKDLLNKHFFQG